MFAGLKKCVPSTSPGRVGGTRDGVHVEGRSVGSKNGAGLHDAVELGEHRELHVHALEHRLDDDVGRPDGVVLQHRQQQRHALVALRLGELALLHLRVVDARDARDATVERGLVGLEQPGGNARVQETDGDAAAHGAGADDGRLRQWTQRRRLGDVGHLAGRALREERMTQALRLRASA